MQFTSLTTALLASVWLTQATPVADPLESTAETQADNDQVLDAILPCGLRVLIAQDLSLPVAAVILAVETGSEDDPEDLPGLSHALAYHLLQGNRELSPGEVLATVHDGGGLSALATGSSQVRFESVVPLSRLDAMLWTESQRLRAPTMSASAWQKSLSWAGGDRPQQLPIPWEAIAAAHNLPGLGSNGRKVTNALRTASLDAVARALRTQFSYARSTLIIVGPQAPKEVLARVTPLFADLPQRARSLPARIVRQQNGTGPTAGSLETTADTGTSEPIEKNVDTKKTTTKPAPPPEVQPLPPELTAIPVVELGRGRGLALVWPVDPNPQAAWVADVACQAINQQRRVRGESRKVRVRCAHHRDPRRGAILLHATGTETPLRTLANRLDRLRTEAPARLRSRQAETIALAAEIDGQTPLGRARLLAATAPATQLHAQQIHVYTKMLGLDLLRDPAALTRAIDRLLDPGRAVALVKELPTTETPEAPIPEAAEQDPAADVTETPNPPEPAGEQP